MKSLEDLRQALPELAKDQKINIQTVLNNELLTPAQAYGCAIASAWFLKDVTLAEALEADALDASVESAVLEDARAAATLMGMTTIYYRTRHLASDEKLQNLQPRLRMNRMAQPATDKAHFELFAVGPAALAGCSDCINAHLAGIQKHELTLEHGHEAIRIASVLHAFSIASTLSDAPALV